ncbi:hypothetical protein [Lactobacillus taiwanensis]|uniref:hypothetical protein n=2 Tax=Lactobacillus taiwanensis TaxID=508451 RepID=UPI00211B4686|nr:hypothetical protein [Lactobacillus taiwanensis]
MRINDHKNNWWLADIGDYLKVIANGCVMLQPIIALFLTLPLNFKKQLFLASLYNFVKFTSPAFIFGIVFTVIRITAKRPKLPLKTYSLNQWNNNFFPTFAWTLAYLILMPNLQQHGHFHNIPTFIWQFFSGNAAPHLWYSVMMLQFLIIMPAIKGICEWVKHSYTKLIFVVIISGIIYFSWLLFYDYFVLNNLYHYNWYLLDRFFLSFLIFGLYGGLSWNFHEEIQNFLFNYWWIVVTIYLITYFWTRRLFISSSNITNLTNDSYYLPSMAIYALAVIFLIYLICIAQKVFNMNRSLKTIHFLAFYEYRAFLANVFWDRILWNYFNFKHLVQNNIYVGIIIIWMATWILSYLSVYLIHQIWLKMKYKCSLSK